MRDTRALKKESHLGALPLRSLGIKIGRAIRSWTQKQVETASGIASDRVSEYERGREPRLATFYRLTDAMRFTRDEADRILSFAGQWTGPARETAGPSDPEVAPRRRVREIAAEAGRAVESLLAAVLAEAQEEEDRRKERRILDLLRDLPVEAWRPLMGFTELHTRGMVAAICEESARAAADDTDQARELAELALVLADQLPEVRRAQAQGYAWGFVANARRVGGELPEAEAAFEVSDRLWQQGPAESGPLDGSRLLDLKASLRKDQRKLDEAMELLDQAERTPGLSALGRARILVKRANILKLKEDFEGAIRALREAAPAIESSRDVRLLSTLRFGLVLNLCHLGQAAEAEAGLPGVRALATLTGKRLDRIRLRWLESKVAAGTGRMVDAVELLSRVRAEFSELEMDYDAALAMVELAAFYLEVGRTAEVKTLTRLSAPVFESKGVHEEAQKALALFRQAVERETVTLELVKRIALYLCRAQANPALRFEGHA